MHFDKRYVIIHMVGATTQSLYANAPGDLWGEFREN